MIRHGNELVRKFHSYIDALIELNLARRDMRFKHTLHLTDMASAREFQTIKIDIGRQTGKTDYIANKVTENSLIVTVNVQNANAIKTRCNNKCKVYSWRQIKDGILRGHANNFDYVFFDEPMFCFKNMDIDDMYMEIMTGCSAPRDITYIHIGC